MSNKDGQPPSYPNQTHYDAGPYNQPPPGAGQDYYGQPQPQQGGGGGGGGGYGQQPMNYGPPGQQPMGYNGQQQPMGYNGHPPPGQYQNGRKPSGATGGICAALCGALACCCCLDCLF